MGHQPVVRYTSRDFLEVKPLRNDQSVGGFETVTALVIPIGNGGFNGKTMGKP